ncbi:hypothetical protein [Fodinibius sediminis]|uniref:Uncharacterized protein n=1 Tax=Fodinibius sediminis TaxID=1214077 RepID=A0A521DJZ2_9BACT|nr:hypothetical protein [Fodinibius sediminis]SMO72039.1 hypothetical protein SAMN06265218_110144 [Fodinibius sediminis]
MDLNKITALVSILLNFIVAVTATGLQIPQLQMDMRSSGFGQLDLQYLGLYSQVFQWRDTQGGLEQHTEKRLIN